MSITLYFAKLNLNSEDIYDLYDNPSLRSNISQALYESICSGCSWTRENNFTDSEGNQQSTYIEYSTYILGYDSSLKCVEGWIYKKSVLHYKKLDKATNQLRHMSTENTEGNRFVLDIEHGFVGYNTSPRFGYKDFIEAFKNLINKGEEQIDSVYRYNMAQCTCGLSLEAIKQELKSIGHIRELRIKMQPPNPSNEVLNELQVRCDGLVKQYKDANVTEFEMLYSTKGSSGLALDSELIDSSINDIQSLYSGLSVEESTKKGYVSVDATSIQGRKFSSGESKPLKKVVEGTDEMLESCSEMFEQIS